MKKLLGLGLIMFSAGAFAQNCEATVQVGGEGTLGFVSYTVSGSCEEVEKYIADKAAQGATIFEKAAGGLGLNPKKPGKKLYPKAIPKTLHKKDEPIGIFLDAEEDGAFIYINGIKTQVITIDLNEPKYAR
jgi:hypothetical protein